jgi:serine/threonine-protein kinase
MACPNENEISVFLEGGLAPSARAAIEHHADSCQACHALLAAAALPSPDGDTRDLNEPLIESLVRGRTAHLAPGAEVGRYVVSRCIGEGGMGVVYAARDPDLARDVAIKLVSPTARDASGHAKRLLREARAAARLKHPNVALVHEIGRAGEATYVVMELVRGRSLRTYIGDPSVPVSARIAWLGAVGRALAAAHAQGIVHRDVKPENVMIGDDGAVKVVDFGIARDMSAVSDTLTAEGAVVGTLSYMAPEQLRGEAADARSDQFAWGVVAYELLTGSLPWKSRAIGVVAEILAREAPPIGRSQGVPEGVAQVVARALAKDKGARFGSIDEVLAALASGGPRPHARGRARRALLIGALGLACVAALLAMRARPAATAAAPMRAEAREPPAPLATAAETVEAAPRAVTAPASARHAATGPGARPKPSASSASAPVDVPSAAPSVNVFDLRK